MARLRPFRGLRYTNAAGDASHLLSPPASTLTPSEREGFAVRDPRNSVSLAAPEGHSDDRSKYIRYARSAARLAEWRREGYLAVEERPSFYRLTQRFGSQGHLRTTVFAVVEPDEHLKVVLAMETRSREDRLRLLEATRTSFEPAVAYFSDPDGGLHDLVRSASASAESTASFETVSSTFETLDDPNAIERIVQAFSGVDLYIADGAEGYEASVEFGGGALVALASLDETAYSRLAVHRVARRLSRSREETLAAFADRFVIEEHHNRNLSHRIDEVTARGQTAFGMATEGGIGYLLIPKETITGTASAWLYREILGPVLNLSERDPSLFYTDPVQAIRATDEGATAAFILPRPGKMDIVNTASDGALLPAGSSRTYPPIPNGLAFWSKGDEV